MKRKTREKDHERSFLAHAKSKMVKARLPGPGSNLSDLTQALSTCGIDPEAD